MCDSTSAPNLPSEIWLHIIEYNNATNQPLIIGMLSMTSHNLKAIATKVSQMSNIPKLSRNRFSALAATCGSLSLLKYCLEVLKFPTVNGSHWAETICSSAAVNGNLECLRYAHDNGCEWNEDTCSSAARNGYLNCLKYAHQNGCNWNWETHSYAANNGHSECLKYAQENGCPHTACTTEALLM